MAATGLKIADGASGVRILSLDRSDRLNAIDMPMIRALEGALEEAAADSRVRAIVLRGEGRAFCAGDDVVAQSAICHEGEVALRRQLQSLQRISELLTLGDKPTVVAVRRWAIGAGFSWVLNCDCAVWGVSAQGFFPEASFGSFVTGGATWLLPEMVGRRLAYDMVSLGRQIDGETALAHGLATRCVPDEAVDEAALEIAATLAGLPEHSLRLLKRALNEAQAAGFQAALRAETEACVATTLDPATLKRMRDAIEKKV